jgi:hypothetical protein
MGSLTPRILTHTVPSVTGLLSITVTEAFNSTMSQAVIEAYDTSLSLGDSIGFNMGYSGDSGKIFQGYVRNIDTSLPEARNRIVCEDELAIATDYFIAANDPQNPLSYSNMLTEDIVEDILVTQAGIGSFSSSVPLSVTWGTQGSLEFNLVTAWQAADTLVGALAWHLYADRTGTVNLINRPPYDTGGESTSFTWNLASEDVLVLSHTRSTQNLRNRVVVYGKNNITGIDSAVSPYLPGGFYKTAVIASQAIDSQTQADTAASNNLTLMNRLTESLTLQVEGDYTIQPRLFAAVTVADTDISMSVSGLWFIYQVEHRLDQSGYICNVTLVK